MPCRSRLGLLPHLGTKRNLTNRHIPFNNLIYPNIKPWLRSSVSPVAISSIATAPPHALYTYSGVIHPKSMEHDRASFSMNSLKRETTSSISLQYICFRQRLIPPILHFYNYGSTLQRPKRVPLSDWYIERHHRPIRT